MSTDLLLRLCYGANILILAPVIAALISGPSSRIFGDVADEPSIRLLVAAFWAGIFLCSVIGMFQPRAMVPILLFQVIYKGLWLLAFALPAWRSGVPVPIGPTIAFVLIVVAWPWVIHAAWRAGG